MTFDPKAESQRLKQKTDLRRKKRYSRSKLDKYTSELLALNTEGCTLEALQIWLQEHRITCDPSTIHRWLKRHA